MEPATLALLVAAAFVAAFIDSIVGGGGVISLPALLAAGLPPHLALGTNKLAATGASLMATVRYTRAGLVRVRLAASLIPLAGAGGFVGAWVALQVQQAHLRGLILLVMAAMTLYVLARPRFGAEGRRQPIGTAALATIGLLALGIGLYDGVLGPGTGTLLIFSFVGILGFDFRGAAAHGRVLNLASNAGALALFALQDRVEYGVGLPMMGAMLAGAYAGSHFGIKHGARWIRPLFVAITLALMARLLLS